MDNICIVEGCNNVKKRKGVLKSGVVDYSKKCYKHSHSIEALKRHFRKDHEYTKAKKPLQFKARKKATRYREKIKKDRCESCGIKENLHMHHPDYTQALLVVTLCRKCHTSIHKPTIVAPQL